LCGNGRLAHAPGQLFANRLFLWNQPLSFLQEYGWIVAEFSLEVPMPTFLQDLRFAFRQRCE
jgi:hypothetical protein